MHYKFSHLNASKACLPPANGIAFLPSYRTVKIYVTERSLYDHWAPRTKFVIVPSSSSSSDFWFQVRTRPQIDVLVRPYVVDNAEPWLLEMSTDDSEEYSFFSLTSAIWKRLVCIEFSHCLISIDCAKSGNSSKTKSEFRSISKMPRIMIKGGVWRNTEVSANNIYFLFIDKC